jgi:hypothetical protein
VQRFSKNGNEKKKPDPVFFVRFEKKIQNPDAILNQVHQKILVPCERLRRRGGFVGFPARRAFLRETYYVHPIIPELHLGWFLQKARETRLKGGDQGAPEGRELKKIGGAGKNEMGQENKNGFHEWRFFGPGIPGMPDRKNGGGLNFLSKRTKKIGSGFFFSFPFFKKRCTDSRFFFGDGYSPLPVFGRRPPPSFRRFKEGACPLQRCGD